SRILKNTGKPLKLQAPARRTQAGSSAFGAQRIGLGGRTTTNGRQPVDSLLGAEIMCRFLGILSCRAGLSPVSTAPPSTGGGMGVDLKGRLRAPDATEAETDDLQSLFSKPLERLFL